jgi:hypothetical protein
VEAPLARDQIRVGVNQGGGPPPGYLWNVWILVLAQSEARKFLTRALYAYLALQVQQLAQEVSPSHAKQLSIDAIEDFHELRDWGGLLYPFNVRVFFGIDAARRAIVVLGVIAKKNDGPTPQGDKIRMRRRWRKYRDGDFGYPIDSDT